MEGASWVATKALKESSKHSQKLLNLVSEFEKRAVQCITDEAIMEVDGVSFARLKEWLA